MVGKQLEPKRVKITKFLGTFSSRHLNYFLHPGLLINHFHSIKIIIPLDIFLHAHIHSAIEYPSRPPIPYNGWILVLSWQDDNIVFQLKRWLGTEHQVLSLCRHWGRTAVVPTFLPLFSYHQQNMSIFQEEKNPKENIKSLRWAQIFLISHLPTRSNHYSDLLVCADSQTTFGSQPSHTRDMIRSLYETKERLFLSLMVAKWNVSDKLNVQTSCMFDGKSTFIIKIFLFQFR